MKQEKLRAFRLIRTEERTCGPLRLRYDLLSFDRCKCPVYGISVTLTTGHSEERVEIFDVTRDAYRALMLFESIVIGTVTPCTLTDVLEDLL